MATTTSTASNQSKIVGIYLDAVTFQSITEETFSDLTQLEANADPVEQRLVCSLKRQVKTKKIKLKTC
ncbi:hypothetical protein [Synechococcus sp. MIT S1220]|uniref:hypothetical protein n=1 Tax=Synechococcus sp. MIT S1220 TaxID=3082549 RepID=UPI0039AF48B9